MNLALSFLIAGLGGVASGRAAEGAANAPGSVTTLPAVVVPGSRLEVFGFDIIATATAIPHYPYVTEVLPNSAAAKAGLRPGDRILKSDGKSAAVTMFSIGKWFPATDNGVTTAQAQRVERAAVAGENAVKWTLEVETPDGRSPPRTLLLALPAPPPRWGAALWQPPEGRTPAKVIEAGPLAERAREILDNGIWCYADQATGARMLVKEKDPARFLLLGYKWSFEAAGVKHSIWVTQQRGTTQIALARVTGMKKEETMEMLHFLTSPAGKLEHAEHWPWLEKKAGSTEPFEGANANFQQEMDFWTTKVRRANGRWPFAVATEKSSADGP